MRFLSVLDGILASKCGILALAWCCEHFKTLQPIRSTRWRYAQNHISRAKHACFNTKHIYLVGSWHRHVHRWVPSVRRSSVGYWVWTKAHAVYGRWCQEPSQHHQSKTMLWMTSSVLKWLIPWFAAGKSKKGYCWRFWSYSEDMGSSPTYHFNHSCGAQRSCNVRGSRLQSWCDLWILRFNY